MLGRRRRRIEVTNVAFIAVERAIERECPGIEAADP